MSARTGRLRGLDDRMFVGVARRHSPLLDRVVPPLTRSADRGGLWLAAALLLAAAGPRGRGAALRATVALNVASGLANGPAKWVVRRPRPPLTDVPELRRLARQPRTTSFPSGHSATAAAFATSVALDLPVAALPVLLLAAGVAYGRVHTGVHYPSDVAAGVATGMAAAVAVHRLLPPFADAPPAVHRLFTGRP